MVYVNADFWRRKRVLLTGHTGFKGSWLSLWLNSLGAQVRGLALQPPTSPNLFNVARVDSCVESRIGDIRNFETVLDCVVDFQPEIVIHMAAQPLVRVSYEDPITTYATNVMGTVHILEAARRVGSVRCIVNVTTDKCYENKDWVWGYREDEPMGGFDPYSSSKGCAELVTSAYRRSFYEPGKIAIASARAGNVIGGGDWAADRLVPDLLRAFQQSKSAAIRNPHAVRPWQHVLEPLSAYLILAERLWNDGQKIAGAWNFGPADDDARSVEWIADRLRALWGEGADWKRDTETHPHEANYLKLDISKAKSRLGWFPKWSLDVTLNNIVHWHKMWMNSGDMQAFCLKQINEHSAYGGDKLLDVQAI